MVNASRSGGYEGASDTYQLSGNGGTLEYSYQMFTIPDQISISTDLGVIFSTGFTSGGSSGTVQIPVGAKQLTVRIATADEGTAWDYSVSSVEPDCATDAADYRRALSKYATDRQEFTSLAYQDLDALQDVIDGYETAILVGDVNVAYEYFQQFNSSLQAVVGIIRSPSVVIQGAIRAGEAFSNAYNGKEINPDSAADATGFAQDALLVNDALGLQTGPGKILSGILSITNLGLNLAESTERIDGLLENRLDLMETLDASRTRLERATAFQNDADAKHAALVEQFNALTAAHKELLGTCPEWVTGGAPTPAPNAQVAAVAFPAAVLVPRPESMPVSVASAQAAMPIAGDGLVAQSTHTQEILVLDRPELGAQVVIGTDRGDTVDLSFAAGRVVVSAGDGADTVVTGQFDDVVMGGDGDDVIDLGAGFDVAMFRGDSSEYIIAEASPGVWSVQDTVADRDGTDMVGGVEAFAFANGGMLLDPVDPPSIFVEDAVARESDGQITFAVSLGRLSDQQVTLPWRAVDPGAAPDAPAFASGTLVIPAGMTLSEISVPIADDEAAGERQVRLELGEPSGGFLLQGEGYSAAGLVHDGSGIANLSLIRIEGSSDANARVATYILEVTNAGTTTARNVALEEQLYPGIEVLSVSSNAGSAVYRPGPEWITASLGDLAPGEAARVEVQVTAAAAGEYVGIARVGTKSLETALENNLLLSRTTFAPQEFEPADLSLGVAADTADLQAGDTVTLTLSLTNDGPGLASGISVAAALPQGWQLVNSSTIQGDYDAATGVWTVGSLSGGIDRTLTLTAIVGQTSETFVAEIVSAQEPDPDSTPGNGLVNEDDYAAIEISVGDSSSAETPPSAPPNDLPILHVERGRFIGTNDAEALIGRSAADRIAAKDGADYVFAGGGSDRVQGQDGDDFLILGDGDDRAYGGRGSDTIWGESGDDRLRGDNDDDVIFGGDGDDRLRGDNGDDFLYGGNGDDRLSSGSGSDTLEGGDDHDRVLGGYGDDLLFGGSGNDRLKGGTGRDILHGGEGDDRLMGGRGADVFHFTSGDSGSDIILDWGAGDAILFEGIDEANVDISEIKGGGTVLAWQGGRVEVHSHSLQSDDIAYI